MKVLDRIKLGKDGFNRHSSFITVNCNIETRPTSRFQFDTKVEISSTRKRAHVSNESMVHFAAFAGELDSVSFADVRGNPWNIVLQLPTGGRVARDRL